MALLSSPSDRGHVLTEHPWTPYWSDYKVYDPAWVLSCIDELYQQKPNLVLCYGDSWTWGDSLGTASWRQQVDDPQRINLLYGKLLADQLDADFANSALPGMSNFWITDRLSVLLNHDIERLSKTYQNIYIVLTLTELGRELDFEPYIHDFDKSYDFCNDINFSAEKCLLLSEKHIFEKIKSIEDQLPANCCLVVGRNFTHTFNENKTIVKHHVDKTWTDLLFDKQNFDYPTDVRIASFGSLAFDSFIKTYKFDNDVYKDWVVTNLAKNMNTQVDLLTASIYNNKIASKHPTADGHRIWADYLYNYIQGIITG